MCQGLNVTVFSAVLHRNVRVQRTASVGDARIIDVVVWLDRPIQPVLCGCNSIPHVEFRAVLACECTILHLALSSLHDLLVAIM